MNEQYLTVTRNLTTPSILQAFLMQLHISQFQLCPSPPPGLLWSIFPPCQSRGWVISNFYIAWELGICQPRGHLPAFDTHVVSLSNITKNRGFYSKHKHIGPSIKEGKKLYSFLKACFLNFMHAFFHYLGYSPFLVLNAFPDFAPSNAYSGTT